LQAAERRAGAKPKNIIFMVADGMSPGVLTLGELFSQRVRSRGLVWQALLTRPEVHKGWQDTASLDSPVTDSSSAASTWGSGSRIFNGWVNMLPDGTALTPIAVLARNQRKRVGLVTTATITHATPAGFAASIKSRDDEHLIAEQYLDRVDVLLGGGLKFFDAAKRADKKDLIGQYKAKGYGYAANAEELKALKASKILGLFSQSHIPYSIDQQNPQLAAPGVPTLAAMAAKALETLKDAPEGFLLQVEGGRVDHAAHVSDAAAMLWEQIHFDEAIATVLRFAERHPDTLVVITSDHGNSNPGLIGMGTEYVDSAKYFERLTRVSSSFTMLTPKFGSSAEYTMKAADGSATRTAPPAEKVQELAKAFLGFELRPAEIEAIRKKAEGVKGLSLNPQLDTMSGLLGQIVTAHTGVSFLGSTHTSDYTLVTALGPGSERFQGLNRNTSFFTYLTELMDVHFRNPSMEPAAAERFKHAAAVRRELGVHWA